MPARSLALSMRLLGRFQRHRNLSGLVNISAAVFGMTTLMLLVQISGVASMAYEVQRLEDPRTYWQESNYRAETEIASLQSLPRIEEEATTRLKMVPAKEPIPVMMSGPFQARPSLPEAIRGPSPKAGSGQQWWQGILDLMDQVRRTS